MGMIFVDTEVFKHDNLICCIDEHGEHIFWNGERFEQYYKDNIKSLWVGYNSNNYDIPILQCILCGLNPKKLNDWIIKEHKAPWQFSELLKQYKFITYDAMIFGKSLKQLESYLGVDIHETDVDFDIDRPLTEDEKRLTEDYCLDDVRNLINVFFTDTSAFDAHKSIIDTFNLPIEYFRYTKAQLASHVLECVKQKHNDEWDIPICDCVKLNKYQYVLDWFKEEVIRKQNDSAKLETEVFGLPTVFGLGGVHGGKRVDYTTSEDEICSHDDVGSLYPSISIQWNLFTRNGNLQKYIDIYNTRMKYKKEKNPLQLPYKLILNSSYGITNSDFSNASDKRNGRGICINGQLMLLMLIEQLENSGLPITPINYNTDAVIVSMPKSVEPQYREILSNWEKITKLKLSTDNIHKFVGRDVNNYIAVFDGGIWERKGGVFKKSSALDYDLPIIQNAVCEYFINGIHPKDYIEQENMLMPFMKTYKVSSSYLYATHNGVKQDGKVFRIFASRRRGDTPLFKAKDKGEKGIVNEKFASCPNCFIENGDIRDKTVPRELNKKWYINYAIKQINSVYGYEKLTPVV